MPPEEGERLRTIREAEKILREYSDYPRDTYKKAESDRACHQELLLRFVSSHLLRDSPSGNKDIKSFPDGSLRIHELGTNRVLQVNQRDVRELPASKPYDVIDPASGHTLDLTKLAPPEHAQAYPVVPIPLGSDVPAAAEISEKGRNYSTGLSRANEDWHNWCACVHRCQMVNQD